MTQVRTLLTRPRLAAARTLEPPRIPALHDVLRSPFAAIGVGWAVAWVLVRPELYSFGFLAAVAVPLAVAAWRYPLGALVGTVAVVPFLQLAQSWLWTEGILDALAASRLAYVKELVVVVVVARAIQHRPATLSTVDKLGVAFIALTALYLVLPLGPSLDARYVSARGNAGFAVLLLAASWLPSSSRLRDRVALLLLPGASTMAVLGVWNRWGPDGWAGWVNDVGVLRFRVQVLEAISYRSVERVGDGAESRIRSGALFFSPNDLGYFMLIAVSVVIARMVQRRSQPWEPAAAIVCLLALYYSGSRSALGLVALAGITAATLIDRVSRRAGAIALTAAVVLFLVVGLGAGSLLASSVDTENESTSQHIEALGRGIGRMVSNPVGTGLGTASSRARYVDGVEEEIENTESFYLLVGAQTGALGAALVVALVATTLRELYRRSRSGDGAAVTAAAALTAVAVGCFVLDMMVGLQIGWTLGLLAGVALARP